MTNREALIEFLDSDENIHGLDHIATHGFLSATIVGPELANWLDILFDNQLNLIPNEIVTAVKLWREAIISELKENENITLPILADGEDDEMDLSVESELGDWCAGFIDAMYGSEENDWFEKSEDHDSDEDEIAILTLPMIVFSGIEEDDEDLTSMRKSIEILAEMADAITKNLAEIYLIFHTPS